MLRGLFVVGLICSAIVAAAQQPSQHVAVIRAAAASFAPLPIMPSCMTVAVQRGDPSTNSASVLVKMTPSCYSLTHWHSADASVMAVSGATQLELRGESTVSLRRGDFIFMPSHHIHGERCLGAVPCTFFVELYGPFDVHYVDGSGKEIPTEEALKVTARTGG